MEEIRESLPLIGKSVAFLVDAATDSVESITITSALVNSARCAIWLKSCLGDITSKNKLRGIPFKGKLLFGSTLETVLTPSAEKSKKFPEKRNKFCNKKPFHGPHGKPDFKSGKN